MKVKSRQIRTTVIVEFNEDEVMYLAMLAGRWSEHNVVPGSGLACVLNDLADALLGDTPVAQ